MDSGGRQIQELAGLAGQFSLLKKELKEINRKLNRLEKRIARAFPVYEELSAPPPVTDSPDLNRESLLEIFEEFLKVAKGQGEEALARKIQEYPQEAIIALASELGTAGGKRMGIRKAIGGIKNKLLETVALSQKSERRGGP